MARFLTTILAAAAALLAAGDGSHATPWRAEVYQHTIMPEPTLPDSILWFINHGLSSSPSLLKVHDHGLMDGAHHTNFVSKAMATGAGQLSMVFRFNYGYNYSSPTLATDESAVEAVVRTVFFREEALRVRESLPLHLPAAAGAPLGFLPRHVADTIPFSTSELPGILDMLGVSEDSEQAAAMEETLRTCESPAPPFAWEASFCTTSPDALVEGVTAALGTRDVVALASTLPRSGVPPQPYTVRAVRPIDDGARLVVCHDQPYPYTVYQCHGTGRRQARAYMVDMEDARGGAVTVAVACHTDTSRWNPEHVSFKLLGTEPGGAPVCHLMPYGHVMWAENGRRSSA
ncbi:hypothetical protein ACP70R_001613 [Stipagrostis hirtigluma subsp. patula]